MLRGLQNAIGNSSRTSESARKVGCVGNLFELSVSQSPKSLRTLVLYLDLNFDFGLSLDNSCCMFNKISLAIGS